MLAYLMQGLHRSVGSPSASVTSFMTNQTQVLALFKPATSEDVQGRSRMPSPPSNIDLPLTHPRPLSLDRPVPLLDESHRICAPREAA